MKLLINKEDCIMTQQTKKLLKATVFWAIGMYLVYVIVNFMDGKSTYDAFFDTKIIFLLLFLGCPIFFGITYFLQKKKWFSNK